VSKVVTLRPAPHCNMTVEQALESAKLAELTEVLIVGYFDDGTLCIRSSKMTRRDALWMAEHAKDWALHGDRD
jgi:hypothetical protein